MNNLSNLKHSFQIPDNDDQEYLTLAIQTVLFNNKDQIRLLADALSDEQFLQEMSDEIVRRARKFKHIAESAAKCFDLQAYEVKGEPLECTTLETRN
ncbi:hypothetical protein SK3146_05025 [Paenibacillus konkukensis]|uniref:Uncharacterized protein n=1 Tax=Paenibacillus konkukensis TaxID=2020716 RepID=A0ABY4RVN3_9BACL|nr:hypothetical protein SK3146_05025 [Paenibacillus konkukensis]